MTSHGPEVLCQLLIRTESIHSFCVASVESLIASDSTTFQKLLLLRRVQPSLT